MSDSLDHETNELAIAERTQTDNRRELELADAVFNHLTNGFNRLERPFYQDDERRLLVIQLVALGYNSLRMAQKAYLTGYYAQTIALCRTA